MQKLISAGFAVAALVTASVPALAWTVWPDVDFEWYADVGRPLNAPTSEAMPAPREGYIWAPAHWETRGTQQRWVPGHWVRDQAYWEQGAQSVSYGAGRDAVALPVPSSSGPTLPATAAHYPDSIRR